MEDNVFLQDSKAREPLSAKEQIDMIIKVNRMLLEDESFQQALDETAGPGSYQKFMYRISLPPSSEQAITMPYLHCIASVYSLDDRIRIVQGLLRERFFSLAHFAELCAAIRKAEKGE